MIRIFAVPSRLRAFAARHAFLLFAAFALLVHGAAAFAATATSRQTGNWNASATWSLSRTGTVTATVGSPAVSGVGTLFTTELAVNDVITDSADVVLGTVKSITSDTQLVLQANAAANLAAQAYAARKAPAATDSAVIGNLAAAHTVTVTANATAAGLTFAAGDQASTVRVNGAVLLTVNGNATINAPTAAVTKRIDLAPAGSLTVNGNMILIGGGTGQIAELRLGGNASTTVTVTSNLTGAGGGSLSSRVNIIFLGTGTLNVGGDFAPGASFTPFSGTVAYNGAADQSVSPQFYNILRIAKSGGNAIFPAASSAFTSRLQLNGGNVVTGIGTLAIVNSACTAANVTRTAGHVVGNLRKTIPAGAPSCTFQVGSVNYNPVAVSFASVSAAFDLTVSTTGTEHPQIAASTLDPARNVSRYWTLSSPGKSFTTYSATFQFTSADVDPGANPLVFHAERFASGAWSVPAVGTRTATSTQATGITTFGDFGVGEDAPALATPGGFNAFETSTPAGAVNGRIYTKLAGVGFDLSVVSINAGAQQASFNANVKVELLGNSATGVALDAQNCPASATVVQTIASTAVVNGRSTVTFAAVGRAWRDVRVRISWPTVGSTVVACSSDNFAIRPVDFSSVSSNMTNGAPGGLPRAKAGEAFTLTAVAGAGYDGTPLIDSAQVAAHAGAAQAGVLAGAFSPAVADTGTAAGIVFTYSEVGNFTLRAGGVYDSGFAAVDSAVGDCTNDFSNTLVGGRYGCLIANSAPAGPFGRFTPDHFDVALNVPAFGAACGGFSYVGQAFNYTTVPMITVTARNAPGLGNAITRNYAGPNDGSSWWKITATSLTGKTYGQFPASPALTVAPAAPDPVIAPGGDGTGTLTFNSGTGFFFARDTALAPFDAEISLAINVIDADNVSHAGNPVKFGDATAGNGIAFVTAKAMRFGRLRLQNANGSQLIALSMPVETQYWNGTAFVTNTLDNCTAITSANVGLGNYQGNLTAGETSVTFVSPLVAGRGTLRLSAPGSGNNGAVDVVVNLGSVTTIDQTTTCLSWAAPAPAPVGANLSHLRGQWCGSSFDRNPTARATFGVFRNTDRFIYQRENF